MSGNDIFPDVSELDRAAGRVSLRKLPFPEAPTNKGTPSALDRVPLGWVWLGLAAGGWAVVGVVVWGVVALAGWLRG